MPITTPNQKINQVKKFGKKNVEVVLTGENFLQAYSQAIEDCKEIRTFDIPKMWGLGTPEDLKYYLENYK